MVFCLSGACVNDNDSGSDGGTSPDIWCTTFVNGSLTDAMGHDGSSWANAFATVQEGLDAAAALAGSSGCSAHEVWVAAGTYMPTADTDGNTAPSDPRTRTISLRPGVALYGGFAGTEASINERNWETNVTTLDGGGQVYHVVTGADDAVIDGFTITGGYAVTAEYEAETEYTGGGMFNFSASPTVANCIFSGNTAVHGGGMYNSSSSPIVTKCSFSNNSSAYGGGMYNLDSSPTVTGCSFSSNEAQSEGGGSGGGMENMRSSPVVTNCVFLRNVSGACVQTGDDNWDCLGPGAGMNNYDSSSPTVTNCTFVRNTTLDYSGGGMASEFNSSPIVTNSILWGNSNGDGDEENLEGGLVTYSVVGGGYDGAGNIDIAPLFVSFATDDLHLQSGSPCIDTGLTSALPSDVTTDLDGNPRVVGAAVDMGAYEVQ